MYRTDFWTLWAKARVGWSERTASTHVYYQVRNRSPVQVGCMRQVLGAGALGWPRGMGWGGSWEVGSWWGKHVNPWLIHVNVWQKPLQYCKVISLQLIKIFGKKNKDKKNLEKKTQQQPWGHNFLCLIMSLSTTLLFFHLTNTLLVSLKSICCIGYNNYDTVLCLVAQSCLTSVTPWAIAHQAPLFMGILQARILEWVAMPSSRGSSQTRDQTQVSCIAGGFFTIWVTMEDQECWSG